MKIVPVLAALALLGTPASAQYQIYGVRFADYSKLPLSVLVLHEDSTRQQPITFIVWALRPAGDTKHAVLFDAGFYREQFLKSWQPTNFQRPSAAIAKSGLAPDAGADIMISHVQGDGLDDADLVPRERIWLQQDASAHYVHPAGLPRDGGLGTVDAALLAQLKQAGRVRLI